MSKRLKMWIVGMFFRNVIPQVFYRHNFRAVGVTAEYSLVSVELLRDVVCVGPSTCSNGEIVSKIH